MESDIKVCQMWVRKLTQDVMMFVWFKQEVIPEKPSPELSFVPEVSAEFMNNFCNSVWMESYCNEFVWEDFLKKHFKRMTTTPYLFTNYVAYACYLLHKSSTCVYESFFYTLSLVTHFVLHCWQRERKEFINTCVDLFCAFFEKEIRTQFEDQEVWQNFNHYLVKQDFLIRYKELVSTNQSVYILFKEFQNRHLDIDEPYEIDNVAIKDITEIQVETHQEAVSFANSVADKIRELCKKTFEEVLMDFAETDRQVEELYRQTVGEACGGMSSEGDQTSSEEVLDEAQENALGKTQSEGNKDQRKASDTLETLDLDTSASQELDLNTKLTKVERVKKLLEEMLEDIAKITELIKFVCDENGTEVAIKVVDTAKNA